MKSSITAIHCTALTDSIEEFRYSIAIMPVTSVIEKNFLKIYLPSST